MAFVSESIIDEVILDLDRSEDALERADSELAERQPAIVQFLHQEDLDLLTVLEQDFLLMLGLTIWEAARRVHPELPQIPAETLGSAEEANYARLAEATGRTFRDRLDGFFTGYPQEDLLAFVEDALLDDEDQIATPEGRETLFVTLKSLIDALETTIQAAGQS